MFSWSKWFFCGYPLFSWRKFSSWILLHRQHLESPILLFVQKVQEVRSGHRKGFAYWILAEISWVKKITSSFLWWIPLSSNVLLWQFRLDYGATWGCVWFVALQGFLKWFVISYDHGEFVVLVYLDLVGWVVNWYKKLCSIVLGVVLCVL